MRLFRRQDGRYYAICEHIDLLGSAVIVTYHGNKNSRAGGLKTYVADTMPIERIVRTRIAHGYKEVPAA